jgi:hypothetical protein
MGVSTVLSLSRPLLVGSRQRGRFANHFEAAGESNSRRRVSGRGFVAEEFGHRRIIGRITPRDEREIRVRAVHAVYPLRPSQRQRAATALSGARADSGADQQRLYGHRCLRPTQIGAHEWAGRSSRLCWSGSTLAAPV